MTETMNLLIVGGQQEKNNQIIEGKEDGTKSQAKIDSICAWNQDKRSLERRC